MESPYESLLLSQEVLQKLAMEHTQYSQRLEQLTEKRFLTDDEKIEEVRLKKRSEEHTSELQSLV